jgi:hypothetical protein
MHAGQPVVRQLLLDALRHWVTEYKVDGFCFVNAENLTQVCVLCVCVGLLWVCCSRLRAALVPRWSRHLP